MMNFLQSSDLKTINKLIELGYQLFSVNGDVHTFVNSPASKFSISDIENMNYIKVNKVFL